MKKQSGFTLIELIVVILILGILAATALPKFVNIENEAQTGAHQGAAGAFQAAIMLVHAKWIAQGKPAAGEMLVDTGTYAWVNASGWAEDGDPATGNVATTTAANGVANCTDLWNNLFQQNGPVAGAAATDDYTVTHDGAVPGVCTFTRRALTTLDLDYDMSNGAIVVDDTP